MRNIRNPFIKYPGYNCFGCAPGNPYGLQMNFFEEGDEVISIWDPKPHFQGYFRMLHGGIQVSLMDEIASWTVYVKLKTAGFTSKSEARYNKAIFIDEGSLTLRAKVLGMRRNLADIQVDILNARSERCSWGTFTYFTYSPQKAKENLYYPDYHEFFQ